MIRVYNKLVRDQIPGIIEKSGQKVVTRSASDGEYWHCLCEKLREETEEFLASGSAEELADILEVVFTLGGLLGQTQQDLLRMIEAKRANRV